MIQEETPQIIHVLKAVKLRQTITRDQMEVLRRALFNYQAHLFHTVLPNVDLMDPWIKISASVCIHLFASYGNRTAQTYPPAKYRITAVFHETIAIREALEYLHEQTVNAHTRATCRTLLDTMLPQFQDIDKSHYL